MKLLTSKAAIMAGIVAVTASGKKWDNDVQILALSTMKHSDKYKECSLMNALVDAIPTGGRTDALQAYFDKFSSGEFIEAKGKTPAHFAWNRNKKMDFVEAQKITWSAFKRKAPYKPLDLCALLDNLVARANKDKHTDYDPELLEGINSLVAKHKVVEEVTA